MATIIKDGIVILSDLDSVAQAKINHPNCTIVKDVGVCGQLYDAKTKTFSNPEPIVNDSQNAKDEIADSDRLMARFGEDLFDEGNVHRGR